MGNNPANFGWLRKLARVSATLACAVLFAPGAAESKARDRDHDGLSNRYELRKSHTNPRRADTDRDRLRDGYEVRRSKTNPRRADTDRDGLSDGFEIRRSKTNPRKKDTDHDGVNDGVELLVGSNPRKPDQQNSALNIVPIPPFDSPVDVPLPDPPLPDLLPPDTSITAGPTGTVDSGSASFSFASSKSGSTFECRLDGAAWSDCSSPKAYSGLADGSHGFAVRATDAAGNTDASPATRSWTVAPSSPSDTTAPDTSIVSGPTGTVTTRSASFTFSSTETGSTFECRLDGGAWASCTSPEAYSAVADGSHTFNVRATDAAGNTDASPAAQTWTVDATAPNTTIGSGPTGSVKATSASFAFTSSESGSTFECRLDGGAWGSCTSPKDYSSLADGLHTFNVRATDAAGNVDGSPAARTWTVDNAAPATTIGSGPTGTVTTASANFTFSSSESGSTFQCRLDGGAWASCTSPKAYSAVADGSHTFDVRAADAAGNVDASPATRSWIVAATGGGDSDKNCMPDPTACGFPDVETTGVTPGTVLTKASGDVTLSTAGQVYENEELTGSITVTAPNVTIRNVKLIATDDWYGIRAFGWNSSPDGLVLDHVEIDLNGHYDIKGIAFDGYTARHVFFHNGSDCAHMGDNVTIEDSLCVSGPDANDDGWPDNTSFCDGPEHFDGFQSDGGGNYTIRHNTIRNPCSQTSAILMSTNTSGIRNVTIQDNLMAGGGYTLYCNAGPDVPNETVTGNRYARTWYSKGGYWGATTDCEDADVYSGNVWDDTGAAA